MGWWLMMKKILIGSLVAVLILLCPRIVLAQTGLPSGMGVPIGGGAILGGGNVFSGNNLSKLSTSAAPSSTGNWNSILTAFTGDLTHMGYGVSLQVTGVTALGQPATGYQITRELSNIASYGYNTSGWNQDTGDNNGRTGALNFYGKADNYGQGDFPVYFCNGFVNSTRSGATSFLASPQTGCLSGGLSSGAAGAYMQGIGDLNFADNGFDDAAIGLNFNFNRQSATGNINANWVAWSLKNQGTLPIDSMIRAGGGVRAAIDLSALTYPDYTLVSVTLTSGGTGYTAGDLLQPPDGTSDQKTIIKVMTVDGSGVILTWALDRAGLYTVVPAVASSVTGGTGTGATFNLLYSTGGNPALVTKADNYWYANAVQDTGVYNTGLTSTVKLGQTYFGYSSSLAAWSFINSNNSILQLYSNRALANTSLVAKTNFVIGQTSVPANLNTGEAASTKIAASGTAIGAGLCKESWVAGTNAGTCKKIAYCGTSTTPTTIIDNVGSGC